MRHSEHNEKCIKLMKAYWDAQGKPNFRAHTTLSAPTGIKDGGSIEIIVSNLDDRGFPPRAVP